MNLLSRLARLEKHALHREIVIANRCSTCGHDPDVAPTYRVEFADEAPPRPHFCPACGRRNVFVLEFDQAG